jgi:hypothetical protein
MLQIRLGAFETNSSSMHSFYIKENFVPKRYKNPKVLKALLVNNDCFCVMHKHDEFLSHIWTVIADNTIPVYGKVPYQECYDAEKCYEYLKPYQRTLKWWQTHISNILKPYNVKIEWQPLVNKDGNLINFCTPYPSLFYPIFRKLLKQPELFVSAVLCRESHFYTGSSSIIEGVPPIQERKGYKLFIAD